jgi:hypothetical protein
MANATAGVKAGAVASWDRPADLIVDVGGADGSLLAQLLASRPSAQGIVFDLPPVVEAAETAAAERGLSDRVRAVGGAPRARRPSG